MTFVTWFVRVLIVLFLVRLAVQLVRGALRSSSGVRRPAAKPPERLGGALVRDPNCGTYIPKDRAIVHGRGETAEYFCSTACRDQWLTAGAKTAGSARL